MPTCRSCLPWVPDMEMADRTAMVRGSVGNWLMMPAAARVQGGSAAAMRGGRNGGGHGHDERGEVNGHAGQGVGCRRERSAGRRSAAATRLSAACWHPAACWLIHWQCTNRSYPFDLARSRQVGPAASCWAAARSLPHSGGPLPRRSAWKSSRSLTQQQARAVPWAVRAGLLPEARTHRI